MRKNMALMLFLAAALTVVPAFTAVGAEMSVVEKGKAVAFTLAKGNCVACHMIEGAESPGTIGPPLVAMKIRFPEKAALRDQIWDPMKRNAETSMPPFGRHGILTEEELDSVVEFIWSL